MAHEFATLAFALCRHIIDIFAQLQGHRINSTTSKNKKIKDKKIYIKLERMNKKNGNVRGEGGGGASLQSMRQGTWKRITLKTATS